MWGIKKDAMIFLFTKHFRPESHVFLTINQIHAAAGPDNHSVAAEHFS